MPYKRNSKPELSNPYYVPVNRNSDIFYGGSQMWFPSNHVFSQDNILHNYGCGTIATADLFLYLALQNNIYRSLETEVAFRGSTQIYSENYEAYIRMIHRQYTKTKRFLAVLGTRVASVINDYSDSYGFGIKASWKIRLSYYDMLDLIEEMLLLDIPVILSIGPNTPKLWGKKGIPFYTIREIEFQEENEENEQPSDSSQSTDTSPTSQEQKKEHVNTAPIKKPYYYKTMADNVNGHFVTVTGVIRDNVANRIMLRISSWGQKYYINYEEYRDYVDTLGDTITSSIVRIQKS